MNTTCLIGVELGRLPEEGDPLGEAPPSWPPLAWCDPRPPARSVPPPFGQAAHPMNSSTTTRKATNPRRLAARRRDKRRRERGGGSREPGPGVYCTRER